MAGLFIIGCFISVSMGTSMGTIAALAPIAVGISEKTGFSLAICIGAVVCGAMFGDNLSMISDTKMCIRDSRYTMRQHITVSIRSIRSDVPLPGMMTGRRHRGFLLLPVRIISLNRS